MPDIGSTNQEPSHVQSIMFIILDPTETSSEAFGVRSLCVHSVRWATKPHPLTTSIHCSYAQHLETQHPEAFHCSNSMQLTSSHMSLLLESAPHSSSSSRSTDWKSCSPDSNSRWVAKTSSSCYCLS